MIQISNKNFPYFLVHIQCKLPYYCWSFFFIYVVGHLGRAGINLSSRKKFILGSFYSSLLLNAGVLMVWRSSCLAYRALRPIFPLDIYGKFFPQRREAAMHGILLHVCLSGNPLIPLWWIIDDFKHPRISSTCSLQLWPTLCQKSTQSRHRWKTQTDSAQDCGQRPQWFTRSFHHTDSFQIPKQWIFIYLGGWRSTRNYSKMSDIKLVVLIITITDQSDMINKNGQTP